MIISFAKGWKKTLDIDGKTNRKEFWAFVIIDLFTLFIGYLSALPMNTSSSDESVVLFSYISIIYIFIVGILGWFPRITILIRRIRDSGRNTIWIFWYLFPVVGWLVLILLTLQPTYSKERDALVVKLVDNLKGENLDKKTNINSLQSKLEELKRLKKEDLVSEEEYDQLRRRILDL
tara:strand:- start:56 stop:586 length:531 start_codon:yes stop_codon:yes gene_type:complete